MLSKPPTINDHLEPYQAMAVEALSNAESHVRRGVFGAYIKGKYCSGEALADMIGDLVIAVYDSIPNPSKS